MSYSRAGRGYTKPGGGAQIDWTHPLARGLIACVPFTERAGLPANLCDLGIPFVQNNIPIWYGDSFGFNGATANIKMTMSRGIANGPYSFSFVFNRPTFDATNLHLTIGSAASTDQAFHLRAASSTSFQWNQWSDDGAYTVPDMSNRRCHAVGSMDFSKLQKFYFDGRFIGQRTAGGFYSGNNLLSFPGVTVGSDSGGIINAEHIYVWNRALSSEEAMWLFQEPYAMLYGSTRRRWYAPSTQKLFPSGVPSRFAAGSPTIAGGSQRLFPSGVPSRFRPGFPTLVGGGGGFLIKIGGVDFTPALLRLGAADPGPGGAGGASAPTIQSQTLGRWTAHFDIFDMANAYVPAIGQTVILMENGTRLFMGCISDVVCERFTSTAQMVYHVTALDKSAILDHRVLNVTYKAGTDVAAAVRDIILTRMAGEGITLTTLAATISNLDQDEQFYFQTARQALDKLATDTSCVWWVDMMGDAHFVPIVSLPACPFSVTETSDNVRGIAVRTTLQDYRNKQWAISNLQVLPAAPGTAGSAAIQITETYTLPQAAAVAAGFLFGTIITQQPIGQITSFKVNSVAQPVYLFNTFYNFRHAWWFTPGNIYVVPPNAANDIPSYPDPPVTSPDPVGGDVVEIKYVVATPLGTPTGLAPPAAGLAVGTPLSPAGGTCGTGVYEAVEQVKNVNLAANLQSIANDVLARSGGVPKYFQCETDFPGAQVGQVISVNLPTMGVTPADSLMITSVNGASQGDRLGFGSAFRWQIIAQTGMDQGNQTKWFERLIARGENPLPIYQYEEATFILAPGTSLSSGVTGVTNPYIVGRSGKLIEAMIIPGVAPVGQDLLIDILQNGSSLFATGVKLTAAAGVTTLQSTSGFVAGSLSTYVFTKDILTVTVAYRVLAGSVTAAQSVTVKLRWAI